MYSFSAIFFAFPRISGSIMKDMQTLTGDPEYGRLGFLVSAISGTAILAGTICAFLILSYNAIWAILSYKAEPPLPCSTQKIMAISNHQNIQDVQTYVKKVQKKLLAESVRHRGEGHYDLKELVDKTKNASTSGNLYPKHQGLNSDKTWSGKGPAPKWAEPHKEHDRMGELKL